MAIPKRLYRVSFLIDASYHWELMEILEKAKAINVESVIVRHGGEDENGQLKSAPTSREFLTAYAASRSQFTVKEAKLEAERLGVKKDSVGAMIYLMKDEGTLKTLGPATYGLRASKENKERTKRALPINKKPRGGPGETIHEKVTSIVRSKQNGTGEGVATMEIKKALGAAGFSIAGTSPAITTAIKKKLIKRVGGGMYRTVEA